MTKPVALPTFSPAERAILAENAARHDLPNRIAQAASEAAELAAALSRGLTGRNALEQIADEAGDVMITLHQLCEKAPHLRELMRRKMHSKVRKIEVRLKAEDRKAQAEETLLDKVMADIEESIAAIKALSETKDAVSDRTIPEPEFRPHYTEPGFQPRGFEALFAGNDRPEHIGRGCMD